MFSGSQKTHIPKNKIQGGIPHTIINVWVREVRTLTVKRNTGRTKYIAKVNPKRNAKLREALHTALSHVGLMSVDVVVVVIVEP